MENVVDRVHTSWTTQGWPVHGFTVDSTVATGQGFAGAQPSGRSGPWRLAVVGGKPRGECNGAKGTLTKA
jgi:hypothetical protein